jgi:peroxiredoxin
MSQRTGQFDAVLEVSLTTVNRILASIHQNPDVSSPPGPPHFLHRIVTRLGDNSPPGPLPGPIPVRGTLKVQLSVPSVALPNDNTQDLIVNCDIRAYFDADPGSAPFPECTHGTVQATFSVAITTKTWPDPVHTQLTVTITNDDNKIDFVPAAGCALSFQEVEEIKKQLRQFLRTHFEQVGYDLDPEFGLDQFKGLSDPQGNQVLAVPVYLSGPAPPGALAGVTQNFLDGSDFALAISKEYLTELLKPVLDQIQNFKHDFSIPCATAKVTVTKPVEVTWQLGKIEIKATLRADYWYGHTDFWVTQDLTLKLDAQTEQLKLVPVGDPATNPQGDPVLGVGGDLHGAEPSVISIVKQLRDASEQDGGWLAIVNSQIQPLPKQRKDNLVNFLKWPDSAADAGFAGVKLDADGVVVYGHVQLSPRRAPYVAYGLAPDGKGYTALDSWIPGGTIDKYTWSWYYNNVLRGPLPIISGNLPYLPRIFNQKDVDRFLFWLPPHPDVPVGPPPPPGEQQRLIPGWRFSIYPDSICLEIQGTAVDPKTGASYSVSAGEIWSNGLPMPPMPSRLHEPLAAIWAAKNSPDPPPDGAVFPDAGIRAHINVALGGDPSQHEQINAVVQIVSSEEEVAPLGSLANSVRRAAPSDIGVSMVLVFRQGLLNRIGPSIIAEMKKVGEELEAIPLVVTEDYQASWSKALGVPDGPATFLINAEGKLAWEHRGALDVGKLMEALPACLTFSSGPSGRPLRLSVQLGDVAPDFRFQYSQGEWSALRKLQGKRVLLNFCQSWSAPCLTELRRLQSVYDQSARDRPVILAIQGDDDRGSIRDQLGLKFPVLPDPNGAIARLYGVRCWPSTLSINQEGRVSRIDMGAQAEVLSARRT